MATRSIPEIDLALLHTNKDGVLSLLRHALVEYGAFYLTSIDEHFDENISELLNDQAALFFKSSNKEKSKISMLNSSSFLGYTSDEDPSTGKATSESIDFSYGSPNIGTEYKSIIGENQFPSNKKFPYFQKSVVNLSRSMSHFSGFITDLVVESLELNHKEQSQYFLPKDSSEKFFKLQIKSLGIVPSSQTPSKSPPYSLRRDPSLLTFTYQPQSKETSIQFQDIFGEWLDVPTNKRSIVVTVGQSLEFITQGVTLVGTYRFTATQESRIVSQFHQHANLESRLSLMTMNESLLKVMKRREQLRSKPASSFFNPESPVAKMLFLDCVKTYREVSGKWYLETLKSIESQEASEQHSRDEATKKLNSDTEERYIKLFIALDSVIFLNVPTKTADIKIFTLLPQIKRLCNFNIHLHDVLQVLYIWPDFVSLKANDDNEFIVDVDETRGMLSIKEIQPRVAKFTSLLKEWTHDHVGSDIPPLKLKDVPKKSVFQSLGKKRSRMAIIQSDTQEQKKRKRESVVHETGLSLLERIQKREQETMKGYISPEQRRLNYLDGKIEQVLDIIATMRPDKPHSIDRLTEQVMTSLKYKNALAEEESRDLVLHLAKKFPDVFKVIQGRAISVLKWNDFNSSELKQRLR